MSLFGIDIASIVSDTLSGQLKPVTITRDMPGQYDPVTDTWEAGTTEEYRSEGIVEAYSDEMIASGQVTFKDRKITILAKSLGTVPLIGDKISIEGEELTVTGTPARDPASATWTIQGEL